MREARHSRLLAAGAVICLALVIPAMAQQQASSFFTGVNPRQIKTVPIDTTKAMKSLNINNAFHPPPKPNFFNMSNILPKFNLTNWPPNRSAQTPVLTRSQNQFQPNQIVGRNLFDFPSKTTKK